MMDTEIFKIDASWAEELTKTRVSFLMNPTVYWYIYIFKGFLFKSIRTRIINFYWEEYKNWY